MARIALSLLFLVQASLYALPTDGLSRAAEYYYSRHDYRQSLQLWNEVVKKQPTHNVGLLRVAELKLMIEGKKPASDFLLSALQSKVHPLDSFQHALLSKKLTRILSTFVLDEAQSFFLQARPKLNFNDCEGALSLLNQSLSLEPENILALGEKAKCERQLEQWNSFLGTAKTLHLLNPFEENSLDTYLSALLYFEDYSSILSLLTPEKLEEGTKNRKWIYAFALVETKADAEANVVLDSLAKEIEKSNPVYHFLKGKLYSRAPQRKIEAQKELELFMKTAAESGIGDASYRGPERVEEAKKILAELKVR